MVIADVVLSLIKWFGDHLTPEKAVFFCAIGVLPAIFWLLFFLIEEKRKKREPKRMISFIFVGGAVSAFVALIAQLTFKSYTARYIADNSPAQIIVFALVEELLKFAFVYLIAHKSKFFDEPVDGMLDMITGAMGFAAFENILFVISAPDIAAVSIFRFIGAVLLHAITSGLIGYYWSKKRILLGLIIAGVLHTTFNFIVLYADTWLKTDANAGVVIAPFFLVITSFFLFRDFDIIEREPIS